MGATQSTPAATNDVTTLLTHPVTHEKHLITLLGRQYDECQRIAGRMALAQFKHSLATPESTPTSAVKSIFTTTTTTDQKATDVREKEAAHALELYRAVFQACIRQTDPIIAFGPSPAVFPEIVRSCPVCMQSNTGSGSGGVPTPTTTTLCLVPGPPFDPTHLVGADPVTARKR